MPPECDHVMSSRNRRSDDGGVVDRKRAAYGMRNPKRRSGYTSPEIIIEQPICQLRRLNDGKALPIVKIGNQSDVTCVGPDSSDCPVRQGYRFVEKTRLIRRSLTVESVSRQQL